MAYVCVHGLQNCILDHAHAFVALLCPTHNRLGLLCPLLGSCSSIWFIHVLDQFWSNLFVQFDDGVIWCHSLGCFLWLNCSLAVVKMQLLNQRNLIETYLRRPQQLCGYLERQFVAQLFKHAQSDKTASHYDSKERNWEASWMFFDISETPLWIAFAN